MWNFDIIISGDEITFKNGRKWKIKYAMSCKSRSVIYVILCVKCNSFYVGQTENLRSRVTLHREQIKHEKYRHLTVSEHFSPTAAKEISRLCQFSNVKI